jgi:hypothetical protein
MTDTTAPGGPDRRAGERRRYNRRSSDTQVTPPYFEAFERIAIALEGIRDQLAARQVVLPPESAPTRPPVARTAPGGS